MKILLLIFICGFLKTYSQNAGNNNLQASNNTRYEDSLQLITYLNLSKKFREIQPDTARFYTKKALQLALGNKFRRQESIAYQYLGIIDKKQRNFKESLSFYRNSLEISEEINWPDQTAAIYNNFGNAYHRMEKLDSAFFFYQQALTLNHKIENAEGLSKTYQNLGNYYASRNERKKSKKHYIKSLDWAQKSEESVDQGGILLNLGNAYYRLTKTDSALFYYLEALNVSISEGKISRLGRLYNNIAGIYGDKREFKEALFYYEKSLAIKRLNASNELLTNAFYNLGYTHLQLKQYPKVIEYANQGLELSKELKQLNRIGLFNELLSTAYEGMGKYRKSLTYFKNYKSYNDTIFNQANEERINELEIKYESEKNKRELSESIAKSEKKELERNYFIIAAVLLLVIVFIIAFFYVQKRRDNSHLKQQRDTIKTREKEKELLLRELHHRVKNNLQLVSSILNLQAYQLKDEAAEAVQLGQSRVEAMAMIHRDLYLKDDITQVNFKVYIQKMADNLLHAFGHKINSLQIKFELEPIDLNVDLAIPASLIINELITNALKYGLVDVIEPELVIALRLHQDSVYMMIRDNGSGLSENSQADYGFGMDMIEALSQQIQGTLMINNDNGCKVELSFPLKRPPLVSFT